MFLDLSFLVVREYMLVLLSSEPVVLHAANNLAVGLAGCGFEARRRTLLRDAYDRATHVLGVEHDTTHLLRTGLASSLHRVGEAPREDMVEAAALLEISVRVARETYGAEHGRTAFLVQFLRIVVTSPKEASTEFQSLLAC